MSPDNSADRAVAITSPRWKSLLLALAAALAAFLLTLVPFVWPSGEVPDNADAVIVLSGDHGERRQTALRLMERGVAPILVLDGTPDLGDEDQLCRDGWRGHEVVCLHPQPDGTREEAQAAGRLAEDRKWKRVIVVTTTYHAVRSALLFERCVDGDVAVAPARRPLAAARTARLVAREWLATAYFALLTRGC